MVIEAAVFAIGGDEHRLRKLRDRRDELTPTCGLFYPECASESSAVGEIV